MDFASLGFVSLMVLGTVNVVTFFKEDLSSREKFAISVVAAVLFGFVPVDLANEIANRIKDALQVALAASGGYKLATKAGGNA